MQKLMVKLFVLPKEVVSSQTRIKTKKIHRVLEFNQSKWLEPYTEFNTHKRIEAEKMETKMEKRCTN